MAIKTYMLMAIPVAHGPAVNRMINVFNTDIQEIPDSGDNLSARLGDRIEDETGVYANEPATHLYGGWYAAAEELAFYQNLATAPFDPPNGWPILEGVTEQEVLDACAALTIVTITGEDTAETPELARQTLFDQLDVAVVRVEL